MQQASAVLVIDMANDFVYPGGTIADAGGPEYQQRAQAIIDRAIQIHGALGVSDDTVLPELFINVRGLLRIGDGPDEVHKLTVAKQELRRWDPTVR